ncbi:MAG: glycosyltransferase family 2 protein [Phenylobacterium sp.]|uniref:glycosyltransferase family 2 protein n=1 Tax=Phenylobacterium sp. TaxID=1871053 RepID=UPI002720C306|nr:glycosyltransferase family 2 protein [Phenylobacterium sp.]MDO8408726.1 glycosyltransferase family 2 protein [Phenylobacterium sp.]
MKVTVAITTYNRPDMLRRAIASVVRQTYGDLEILVCDDASSYDVAGVLAEFDDPRLALVAAAKNGGIVANRNRALQSATGDFFCFLDDDDIYLPEKVERCLAEAISHPGDIVFSQITYVKGDRTWQAPADGPRDGEPYGDYTFLRGGLIHLSACLFPAALGRAVGFGEGLRRHEDFDFLARMTAGGARLVFLPRALAVLDLTLSGGRFRRSDKYQETLQAFEVISPLLSERARLAFLARLGAPKYAAAGLRWRAVGLVLNAYRGGALRPRNAAKLLLKALAPLSLANLGGREQSPKTYGELLSAVS